jgi:para-aminobenzoate synthetase component I
MSAIKISTIHFDRHLLLRVAEAFANEPGTSLLYSGGDFDASRQSSLWLFPFESICMRLGQLVHVRAGRTVKQEAMKCNPWDAWRDTMSLKSENTPDTPAWIGFIGYEMGVHADSDYVSLPVPIASDDNIPDLYFQRCALTFVVDHSSGEATIFVVEEALPHLSEAQRAWIDRLSDPLFWEKWAQQLAATEIVKKEEHPLTLFKPLETPAAYFEKIQAIQELIRAGEIYQVNISQEYWLAGRRDPFALFKQLALRNPAPFSAYLNLAEFALVSSSPERFLCKQADRLETRPIKGTAPRGKTPQEDAENRFGLLNSEKERAELLMITDLMRNDLGRVSLPGSVTTHEIWRCEAYTNVFHQLSVISSRALPHLHPIDIVRQCFPGGSITGCPKMRAMQVISALEQRCRGIYTGSIGYFTAQGDFDLNIAIRTMTVFPDRIHAQFGGGIVIDSDPQREYEETLHKGKTIFQSLGVAFGGVG